MRRNLFIALEGLDGSGKTTQARLLADKFRQSGYDVYATSEPTENRIGQLIRDIFRHKMEADHRTIAALYAADRLEHLLNEKDGILMQLGQGRNVITDRYYFSSYAYHGVHMSMDWVIGVNSLSADLLRPDLNIFIDTSPDICMQRLNEGRKSMQLYETIDNLQKVRMKYFEAFEKMEGKERIFITDGNRRPEEIAEDVWQEISPKIYRK